MCKDVNNKGWQPNPRKSKCQQVCLVSNSPPVVSVKPINTPARGLTSD